MPTPDRRRYTSRFAVAVLSAALALASCGVDTEGGDGGSGSDVVGAGTEGPGVTTTTEPKELLPDHEVDITGDDGSDLNRVAANAIGDIETFWETEYPEVYGEPYEPLTGGVYGIDTDTDPLSLPCRPNTLDVVLWNAYYCGIDDAVAWDQEFLMPTLAEQYGDFTVAVVLAHEWGHVVQGRTLIEEPTVVTELQADCFAGAWVHHVQHEPSRFDVDTHDLDLALAGVLSLRDAPGSSADDVNAHGSGFDRVSAFQEGYEGGADACKDYTRESLNPYQFPFQGQEDYDNQGNMPFTGSGDQPGIDTAAFESLEQYWAIRYPELSGGDAWEPLADPVVFTSDDPAECNGREITEYRLFLCVPERFVAYDVDDARLAWELGDFAVGALFGTQYGLHVLHELDAVSDDEVTSTLRADCLTGAWAAALLPDDRGQPQDLDDDGEPDNDLVLSPGDLDEAVQVLLSFRNDSDRERQGPGFNRVRAFRIGVLESADACLDLEP